MTGSSVPFKIPVLEGEKRKFCFLSFFFGNDVVGEMYTGSEEETKDEKDELESYIEILHVSFESLSLRFARDSIDRYDTYGGLLRTDKWKTPEPVFGGGRVSSLYVV